MSNGLAKKRPLSDRALMILRHIADRLPNRWLPGGARGMDDYDKPTGVYLNIGHSGDAAILRSLLKVGLINQHVPKQAMCGRYDYLYPGQSGLDLLYEQRDRVAAIRQRLYSERRGREYAQCVRKGWDEQELRELFPEMYSRHLT